MRTVPARFAALIPHWNRWTTIVEWSNDGFTSQVETADLISGSVTASSLSQTRWTCDLTLTGVTPGLAGINAYNTQLRIRHGIDGQPLLPMGVYQVNTVTRAQGDKASVQVQGASFEGYLIAAQFTKTRTFRRQQASDLATALITEVLPGAQIAWLCGDQEMPRVIEPTDRWPLIDGNRDAKSVARALGARIFCTAAGNWAASPVPSVADDAVWEATEGPEGVLISSGESLTNEGVFNIATASGQSTSGDVEPFRPGVAMDLDPLSPTYVYRPIEQGGIGPRPENPRYVSQLITSTAQGQTVAQSRLASALGLKQVVTFSQLHDPRLEPGDVGIVHCTDGDRRVLPDALTYDLLGGPLQAQTRTTATNLGGTVTEIGADDL